MFEVESGEETEHPDEGVCNHVHVVTSNLFNIARVFADEDNALHYALQIFKAIEITPLLTYARYRLEYTESHHVHVSAGDLRCMITATVRKLRIRRDRCYTLDNE